MLRDEVSELFNQEKQIRSRITAIQEYCDHKTSVYEARGSGGNWDRDDSYWYNFYCYDCQKRWSHDQNLGYGNSMKVDKIDYSEKPEIIELKMKIEELKR